MPRIRQSAPKLRVISYSVLTFLCRVLLPRARYSRAQPRNTPYTARASSTPLSRLFSIENQSRSDQCDFITKNVVNIAETRRGCVTRLCLIAILHPVGIY